MTHERLRISDIIFKTDVNIRKDVYQPTGLKMNIEIVQMKWMKHGIK
jgi:hypothetical protein